MENKKYRFNWLNVIIWIIIFIILFILLWGVIGNNKQLKASVNNKSANTFKDNLNSMKEAGKNYFTTERLPIEVGDIKSITLQEMLDQKLLLDLIDENGNACSSRTSYISVEKFDNEYQMKVYLECGEKEDYIIVIMGCYDYCHTSICEKNDTNDKITEYEYKLVSGGKWSSYGNWSEWSKVAVSKTNYREVETKVLLEDYTYNKEVTKAEAVNTIKSCEEGYTYKDCKCVKTNVTEDKINATCGDIANYTFISEENGICYYSLTTASTTDPVCENVYGYTFSNRNGFTCNYYTSSITYGTPVCPSVTGYTYTGINGLTCSYKSNTSSTVSPTCPEVSGYTYTGINGLTCNYSKTTTSTTEYDLSYLKTANAYYMPSDTSTYHYEYVSSKYVYDCVGSCSGKTLYTYNIYQKTYKTTTSTTTKSATCPSGYTASNGTCVGGSTSITKSATCPSGYYISGSSCIGESTSTISKSATCPSGYSQIGNTCTKANTATINKTATCQSGYTLTNGKCLKTSTTTVYGNILYTCPSGYTKQNNDSCSKSVISYEATTVKREVKYYRYRLREYVGGTATYKWSTSNKDSELIKAGYYLTGKTR